MMEGEETEEREGSSGRVHEWWRFNYAIIIIIMIIIKVFIGEIYTGDARDTTF